MSSELNTNRSGQSKLSDGASRWQQRIRGRFATPLVQAHRRLLLDGQLMITRNVKRSATLVEVPGSLLVDENADRTITNAKTVVQVETLIPEIMERPVLVLLASDMMLLCKDPSQGQDPDCAVELFAVLKLQTKSNPASVINGNGIRLVDNRVCVQFSLQRYHNVSLCRFLRTEYTVSRCEQPPGSSGLG